MVLPFVCEISIRKKANFSLIVDKKHTSFFLGESLHHNGLFVIVQVQRHLVLFLSYGLTQNLVETHLLPLIELIGQLVFLRHLLDDAVSKDCSFEPLEVRGLIFNVVLLLHFFLLRPILLILDACETFLQEKFFRLSVVQIFTNLAACPIIRNLLW